MEQRVAPNLTLLPFIVRGEDDVDLHFGKLTDQGGRREVNQFTVFGEDSLCRQAHQFSSAGML